jgi:ferritin
MELKKNEPVAKVVDSNGYDMSVCTIHPDLQKMLVEQMAHELYNHNLYRAFANFYSVRGFKKLSDYYSKRAHEEYEHYMWCVDFANEVDMEYTTPSVDAISEKWSDDLVKPFHITVDVEIDTTDMIYDMADKAKEVDDHIFLQWLNKPGLLVDEQNEELSLSRKALCIMKTDDSILAKQDAIEHLYGN